MSASLIIKIGETLTTIALVLWLALWLGIPVKITHYFFPFQDNQNGLIFQRFTENLWFKCSEGLSGPNCLEGNALLLTWNEAQERAEKIQERIMELTEEIECRLPTKEELASIVSDNDDGAQINEKAFANTMPWFYWSGTLYETSSNIAWDINFADGRPSYHSKQEKAHVRIICKKKILPLEKSDTK